MKTALNFLCLLLFLSACSNTGKTALIDEKLLNPRVAVAQEFVDHLKRNERFYVLTLVYGYDPDAKNNKFKTYCDDQYAEIQPYAEKYKLKSVSNWHIYPDTVRARTTDFMLCFEHIMVPFDAGSSPKDPAYLRISFNGKDKSDKILQYEVILNEEVRNNGDIISIRYQFSDRQSRLLDQ